VACPVVLVLFLYRASTRRCTAVARYICRRLSFTKYYCK